MTLSRIAAFWRIPLGGLLGLISLGIVLVVGDLNLRLPMTDGPRMVRQAIILALPVTLSALLVPPLPDIHTSLLRVRLHHWVTRGSFWTIMTVVCSAAWVGRGLPRNLVLFEMTSTFSVAAAALFFVPRWGVRTILGLTGVSCAWLLYGAPVSGALGFGDLLSGGDDPYLPGLSPRGWILTAVSLCAYVPATMPTKTRATNAL